MIFSNSTWILCVRCVLTCGANAVMGTDFNPSCTQDDTSGCEPKAGTVKVLLRLPSIFIAFLYHISIV